jgi:hypothetical protein
MVPKLRIIPKAISLGVKKSRGFRWRLGLFTLALFTSWDSAALVQCDVLDKYPTVFQIRETDGALEFLLSGENYDRDKFIAPAMRLTKVSDDYKFVFEHAGQRKCREGECRDVANTCQAKIPKIELTKQSAKNIRMLTYTPDKVEQNVKACVTDGDVTYFGISFYDGEGTTGVGGIGRFDSKTGEVEIRRLPILHAVTVDNLAFDGRFLWIGTSHDYECSDPPPAQGLLIYDWEQNLLSQESKKIGGICGFRIYDIHIKDDRVWVATELGVSQGEMWDALSPDEQLSEMSYGWRHFAPVKGNPPMITKVSCDELTITLLNTLEGGRSRTGLDYDELFNNLARFRPTVLRKYVDRIGKNSVRENISQ